MQIGDHFVWPRTESTLFPVIFRELAMTRLKSQDAKQRSVLLLKFGINKVFRMRSR